MAVKWIRYQCQLDKVKWNNTIVLFILGRIQNQFLAQTTWRWNLRTPHASKQLKIINWFHTIDISVHSSDPKFAYSPNLVCGWDTLDPPKKGPNWPRLSGSSDPLSTLFCSICIITFTRAVNSYCSRTECWCAGKNYIASYCSLYGNL